MYVKRWVVTMSHCVGAIKRVYGVRCPVEIIFWLLILIGNILPNNRTFKRDTYYSVL